MPVKLRLLGWLPTRALVASYVGAITWSCCNIATSIPWDNWLPSHFRWHASPVREAMYQIPAPRADGPTRLPLHSCSAWGTNWTPLIKFKKECLRSLVCWLSRGADHADDGRAVQRFQEHVCPGVLSGVWGHFVYVRFPWSGKTSSSPAGIFIKVQLAADPLRRPAAAWSIFNINVARPFVIMRRRPMLLQRRVTPAVRNSMTYFCRSGLEVRASCAKEPEQAQSTVVVGVEIRLLSGHLSIKMGRPLGSRV